MTPVKARAMRYLVDRYTNDLEASGTGTRTPPYCTAVANGAHDTETTKLVETDTLETLREPP